MSRNTIILTICMVIVVGGLGYYFFFYTPSASTSADATLTTTPGAASDAELRFVALVGKLDPIVFDTTILSDPRFTSRQDIRTTILPEAAGRKDPFAQLGH